MCCSVLKCVVVCDTLDTILNTQMCVFLACIFITHRNRLLQREGGGPFSLSLDENVPWFTGGCFVSCSVLQGVAVCDTVYCLQFISFHKIIAS